MTDWLLKHRLSRPYGGMDGPMFSAHQGGYDDLANVAQTAFNNHAKNTGAHVSPFDTGTVQVGVDGLEVRLMQGLEMDSLFQVVASGTQATIGRPRPTQSPTYSDRHPIADEDWKEMFKGGLQAALESQTVVFEVWGASRVLTHQLVRSRRAGFHQQSQRSTWYGDRPEVRMPETVWRAGWEVRTKWLDAYKASWGAYAAACDVGVPYEDARYILPEGTVNYIQCEYTIREFIAVYAYRGCSMFLREMVECMRAMRALIVHDTPDLAEFIKISCEKSKPGGYQDTSQPGAPFVPTEHVCTFQGWENVELACSFPWAKESNRVFVASPRLRIGAK